ATDLIPCCIGGSWIRIGGSLFYHCWNTCYPSLLFLSSESAAVRGYHPAARRCFT
ncbi:hypothetical protein HAX54_013114, partial [Datura stramonium]|nr:hypothetical protein [Datura stramonium]